MGEITNGRTAVPVMKQAFAWRGIERAKVVLRRVRVVRRWMATILKGVWVGFGLV